MARVLAKAVRHEFARTSSRHLHRVEIYYTGRSEGESLRAAFVLCDDYTELTSKLWLLTDNPRWSDTHDREARKLTTARQNVAAMAKGQGTATPEEIQLVESGDRYDKFKAYPQVMNDVREVFQTKRVQDVSVLEGLQHAMKDRRKQRNGLFHSAHLLSLNVHKNDCIEAFCDLLTYGRLLFSDKWNDELGGARQLKTMEILLRLEKKTANNPALHGRIGRIFEQWRRNETATVRGAMVVRYPDDLHLRLCVIHGDSELRNQLQTLLDSCS